MGQAWRRSSGVKGLVCALGIGMTALTARAEGEAKTAETSLVPQMTDLRESGDLPGVVVYPAEGPGPHPITVLLHGMCGEPTRTCAHFAAEVTHTAHLVCPRARTRCEGGGATRVHDLVHGVASRVE